jgi:hypothetical protein
VSSVDPLQLAALRLVIGEQPSEDLPGLATDALVRGLDSPSLRELAGAPSWDVSESQDLFLRALDELGINRPDEQGALWEMVRDVAIQITTGKLEPYAGARWIWWHAYDRVELEGDLRIFVGLASAWEDHPSSRPQLGSEIVEEARLLLARAKPRRWIKVMARRGCPPLSISPGAKDVDPGELPIDAEIAEDLALWAAEYDSTFVDGNPKRQGFASLMDADEFVDRGRQLALRLQAALGPSWCVEYMPEPVRPPGVRLRE